MGCGCGFAWTVYAVTDAYLHNNFIVYEPRLCLPMPFSFFFSSQYILLSGSSGRTGEPREDVVDIDTGLMICNATNISSWVSLTVSGQSSKGQLINCWIRAPPRGGGGHVTFGLTKRRIRG